MKWSTQIAKVADIRVYLHATFWLLILWVAYLHWNANQALATVVQGVAFILLLFVCVTLHELGHALAARQFGIATRVDDDRVVGVLTRSDLLTALAEGRKDEPVRAVMQRDIQVVTGREALDSALERFQACDCRTLPVVRNGRLVGLITAENVSEFFMIQSALLRRCVRA